jgi:hypothetical protein
MTTVLPAADKWVPELTFGARLALVRHRMGWNIKEDCSRCGLSAPLANPQDIPGNIPVKTLRDEAERHE